MSIPRLVRVLFCIAAIPILLTALGQFFDNSFDATWFRPISQHFVNDHDAFAATKSDTPFSNTGSNSTVIPASTDAVSAAPDGYGYTWIDNNAQLDPPGPTYNWIDISTTGTTGPTGDDVTSAMVPLGFTFPFYGMNFTSVTMSTDGWLSFNSAFANLTSGYYAQYSMPATTMPQSLIAVLYRDSYVTTTGRYIKYQQYDANTFIVQWYTDSGEIFEAILYSSGNILLQYNTSTVNTSTIGIQNDTRTIASQYQYSTACPVSGRAILFVPPCNTATQFSPANGTIGVTTEIQTLTWVGGSCTANYDLYCSTVQADVSSGAVAAQQLSGSTATSFIMPITPGNVYYWKVVAHGTSPATNTSPIWTFNTIAALTGTKTINPALPTGGDNYQSFAAAILALYTTGSGTGGVTFNVSPGTYTEQVTFTGAYPGMSPSNPVVFRATGGSVTLSPTVTGSNQYGVKITGAQYLTFDGISVTDVSTGTNPLYYGYWLNNSAATLGARYNTIKNATIQMRINSSYPTYGVYQYYNTSIYPASALGSQSYNRYLNLKISKVRCGVYCYSYSSYPDMGNEIGSDVAGFDNLNRFTIGAAVNDTIGGAGNSYGVLAYYQNGLSVHDIDIKNMKTYSFSYTMYGMYLYYSPYTGGTASPLLVYNNRIYDFTALNTSGYTIIYGIYSYFSSSYGHQRIYNNMVYNLQQTYSGTTTASYYTYGIYCGFFYPSLIHNTIMLNQTGTQNFSSACLYYTSNYAYNDTCKNNIFANLGSQTSTTPFHVGMYNPCTYAANWMSDYNNFYIPNTVGGYIGYKGSAYRSTLSAWQTVYTPNGDLASTSGDPTFENSTSWPYNPHIRSNPCYSRVENDGTPTFVTTDIDGETRSLSTPDVGADEGLFISLVPSLPSNPNPPNFSTGIVTNATFSWTAPTCGMTPITYDIYLGTTNPPTTRVATGLNTPYYTPSTSLLPMTQYYWYITSNNLYGSAPGPVWSFDTYFSLPCFPGNSDIPVTSITNHSMTIHWIDNCSNEIGFPIFRSTDGVEFSNLATAPTNSTQYSDTAQIPGTRYWYQIHAQGSSGITTGYATADGWTNATVPILTNNTPTLTTVPLVINGVDNSAAVTYSIFELNTNQYLQSTGILGATPVWQNLATWGMVTVAGLSLGTNYRFAVKARNGASVETNYSDTVSVTTVDPYHAGPDAYGYRMVASNGTGYNWITPSASATMVSGWTNTDDGFAGPYNIGFPFTFYGRTYTTWYAGSNGRIQFGGQNPNNYSSASFPLTGGYPAGVYFWNYDMSVASTTVKYENLTAPTRLVITYTNFAMYGGVGPIAAQVVVYENGNIDVNYGSRSSTTQTVFAAAAIQDTNGANGYLQYGPPVPDSLRTYHFFKLNAPTTPIPDNGATGVPINATLSWTGDANATGYDVYLGTSNPPTTRVVAGINSLYYTPSEILSSMTQYYWYVVANNSIWSIASPVWSFNTNFIPPPCYPGTAATPVTAITSHSMTIHWMDNCADEIGFPIMRSTNGVEFTNLTTAPVNSTQYTDTSVTPGTHYRYRIFKQSSQGITTGFATADGWTNAAVPVLTYNPPTLTTIPLVLNGVDNPATVTYAVHELNTNQYVQSTGVLSDTMVWQNLATWGATVSVNGLANNTNYRFISTARNANGDVTANSDTVSASTLGLLLDLYCSRTEINFADCAPLTSDSVLVKIANRNPVSVRYLTMTTLNTTPFRWRVLDTDSTTAASDTLQLWVRFYPDSARNYHDTLRIAFEAPYNPIAIPLSGNGIAGFEPAAPGNLSITLSGYDVQLNWDRVDTSANGLATTVDRYLVFHKNLYTDEWAYLGQVVGAGTTFFTDLNVAQTNSSIFYQVKALSGSTDSFDRIIRELQRDHARETIHESEMLKRLDGRISNGTTNEIQRK